MSTIECQSCLTSETSGEEATVQNWHLYKPEVVKWSRAGSQPFNVEMKAQEEKDSVLLKIVQKKNSFVCRV